MISTILFIDQVPVGYSLEQKGEQLHFIPSVHSQKDCCPPTFSLTQASNQWSFDTVVEIELQKQVMNILDEFEMGKLIL